MKETVGGNTENIKAVLLDEMACFIGNVYEPGVFLPAEILELMTRVTLATGREIAVLLDRKNRVTGINVGDASCVKIPDASSRRAEGKTAGVRLLHTHPNGTLHPSSEDIASLKNLSLDAMAVIGIKDGGEGIGFLSGASVSVLTRKIDGSLGDPVLHGPVGRSGLASFDRLFDEIEALDRSRSEIIATGAKDSEKAILVGVVPENEPEDDMPLAELKELAQTAGAETVLVLTQRRPYPDSRYYVGSGMADEIAKKAKELDADLIIFDDELSPSQIRNLEDITDRRVIDRTALILDIFAARARSKEGRLQVELAQQKYRLPRLTGKGIEMSRLGGGIGTRGPGESKLESDRRHINRKIHTLESQLKEVSERRELLRRERKRRELPVIAAVGYTNAGKSTLVNRMCDAGLYAEDELFATLDTSVRRMNTESDRDFLMIDTVGFIRKLPHDLVEAFKSTLEEAVFADLLLHVVDVTKPGFEDDIVVVEQILKEIGAGNRPRYLVLNKVDMLPEGRDMHVSESIRRGYGRIIPVSALSGEGTEELGREIGAYFTRVEKRFSFLIPYSEGSELSKLHELGTVEKEEWNETGALVTGHIPSEYFGRFSAFRTDIRHGGSENG